jgi:hypothetical protein
MATFTNDERTAMRSFLQRVEVRLSTMHRVGSAFLGGAGLLILFPVFFKEVITGLIIVFISPITKAAVTFLSCSYFLLVIPFSLSLVIPLYALYLLLHDLVSFYFVGHSPGYPPNLFNPRFVLSGLAFSPDESESVKREILKFQYGSDLINFVIPFGEAQLTYYDEIIKQSGKEIIPEERRREYLMTKGIIEETNIGSDNVIIAGTSVGSCSAKNIDRFNATLGLAGVRDRRLVEEVAKGEASLVRHAISLRRLVLRYMKALLMFIVTTLISFLLTALVQVIQSDQDKAIMLSIGYMFWSVAIYLVVRSPIRWIYAGADPRSDKNHIVRRDNQLVKFEKLVFTICIISLLISLTALIIAIIQ